MTNFLALNRLRHRKILHVPLSIQVPRPADTGFWNLYRVLRATMGYYLVAFVSEFCGLGFCDDDENSANSVKFLPIFELLQS
jgi:hypothetical protein